MYCDVHVLYMYLREGGRLGRGSSVPHCRKIHILVNHAIPARITVGGYSKQLKYFFDGLWGYIIYMYIYTLTLRVIYKGSYRYICGYSWLTCTQSNVILYIDERISHYSIYVLINR